MELKNRKLVNFHFEFCKKGSKAAFTLAEMLIALAVIGIVAALTLPTLMTTISDKIKENQIEVFERKISKGTDLLNIENGIGPYYTSSTPSYEFAQALSKHLKIATICDKNNLKKCFNYDTIQTDLKNIKVEDIKTGEDLQLNKNDYTDVAGIVLGDGTPMIFSWNKNCPVSDPDSVNKGQTTACIQGIYDLNGSKGPNRMGSDVVSFGSGNLGWINFAGLKISMPFAPQPLKTSDYCDKDENGNWTINDYGSSLGIKYCCSNPNCLNSTSGVGDFWAGAMKTCKEMGGHLISQAEIETIARYLYNMKDEDSFDGHYRVFSGPLDKSKLGALAKYGSSFTVWQASEAATYYSYCQKFTSTGTKRDNPYRQQSGFYGICVKQK